MFAHYLKVTFRQIRKSLLVSLLNISGLAIGIACFIFIMLFVNHELNYDRHNVHFDDIYRCAVDIKSGNSLNRMTWTPAPLPEALYEEFPEVIAVSRIYDRSFNVKVDKLAYNENKSAAVDSSFTDIFTLNFVEGSPDHVLSEPGQVLLDQSTAHKYFGEQPAYGEVIILRDTIPLTVVGVYEDFPPQTHFHFNMLVSLVTIDGEYNRTLWDAYNFKTYLRLEPGFSPEHLEAKFPDFVDKYMIAEGNGPEGDDYRKLYLQHIREIHLGSDLNMEFEANGNLNYIRIFSVVAILVLVVACINFMNLTTASSSIRVKEIGIRKATGASRKKLRKQFFIEAILISILSMILSMILVESFMGAYQNFTGREIEMLYMENLLIVPALLGLAILVGMLSGSYPALHMSGFSVIDSLGYKGIKQTRSWFRNVLVLFQFSVAIFLIAATILVQKQMQLVLDDSLGFDKEQVILVNNASDLGQNLDACMDELRTFPEIVQLGSSRQVPGDRFVVWGFAAQDVDEDFNLNVNTVDEYYQSTLRMEMAEGRFFSEEFGGDVDKVILNETAVKMLGYEDPIGKTIYMWGDSNRPYEVIGVIRDYHWESKQQEVKSHVLMNQKSLAWATPRYLIVRTAGKSQEKVLKMLEDKWKTYVQDMPFEYEFLDQHYESIYDNEKRTRSLLYIFSFIAIFISCLGLFGLASFMAARRTKEIGIRKANGATTMNILKLLSLDFTKWVLLANVIAWPLTWFALKRWLESFAYRVDMQLWVFAIAGILAFFIALFTVSHHAIQASRQNPGLLFRYE